MASRVSVAFLLLAVLVVCASALPLKGAAPAVNENVINAADPLNCPSDYTFTASSGDLDTNAASAYYPNSADCHWLIAPTAITPDSQLVLSFTKFATETNWDWLYIYIGAATKPAYSFSGKTVPADITAPAGESVKVQFVSDASVAYAGVHIQFKLIVVASDPLNCPADYQFTSESGDLDTNTASATYPNSADCHWLIAPDALNSTSNVVLHFSKFATEAGFDFLNVFIGAATKPAYSLSGSTIPADIAAPAGESVKVQFVSDASVTSGGVHITFKLVVTESSAFKRGGRKLKH